MQTVVLYGAQKRRTAKAVLWHVWIDQPSDTPRGLCGQKVWFPYSAGLVMFRDRSGRNAIEVPLRLVEERIAALSSAPEPPDTSYHYERQEAA